MKKLFTSVALALALMSASAENYTCPLQETLQYLSPSRTMANTPWISKTLLWVTWELEIFILRT